ncbi:MAG TPA: DUF4390 domain-containing protein [Nitrospiria bacterium]|jgi:hypothetical protein|nr:DUF4390 domain-containing protein [Nitrospiria bacterium]
MTGGRNRKALHYCAGVLAVVLITLAGTPRPAVAGEERIAGLTASVIDNGTLTVTADLIRWYNRNLQEDLNNGIPKDLYYYILLKKRQPGWFDEEVFSKTIKHTIKYDVLKKQYSITTRTDGEITQKTVQSFEEMAPLISRIDHVKIITPGQLKTRHTYYVSVKAEMRATNVPFYLEYILFFIPALELDTPWADSAPFYSLGRTP